MEYINTLVAYAIFTAGTIAVISYSVMASVLITVLYGKVKKRKVYKIKG